MIAISSDTPAPLDSVESFFDIVWEDAVALDAAEHNSRAAARDHRSPLIVILVSIVAHSNTTHDSGHHF